MLLDIYLLFSRCGLRDVPTLVANMMLPFGNMTVSFVWGGAQLEAFTDLPPDVMHNL